MVLLGTLQEYTQSDISAIYSLGFELYTASDSVYEYLLSNGVYIDMAYLIVSHGAFVNNAGELIGNQVYIPENFKYKGIYSDNLDKFKRIYLEDIV